MEIIDRSIIYTVNTIEGLTPLPFHSTPVRKISSFQNGNPFNLKEV